MPTQHNAPSGIAENIDLILKRPLTNWAARHLRRDLVFNHNPSLDLQGISPAHIQAVIGGAELPNHALMKAIYPDPEDLELQTPRDPDYWPDGREMTDEEKVSTSLCVRDAFALSQAPGGYGPGDDGLSNHLNFTLMEHGVHRDIFDVSQDDLGLIFLAGALWGQQQADANKRDHLHTMEDVCRIDS